MLKYNVKKYIEEMILHNYYIILIIEDLTNYFGFKVNSDNIKHDIRTIEMKNYYDGEFVKIKSYIISYFDDTFTQHNEIYYIDKLNNEWDFSYIGKCHRIKNII